MLDLIILIILVMCTNYEAPHYAVFSDLPRLISLPFKYSVR
jgi:hypothetical protein